MTKHDKLHPIDTVRMLVATGEPDPRALQIAFTVFVALDFASVARGAATSS